MVKPRLLNKELGQKLGDRGVDAMEHANERFQRTMEKDKAISQRIERIFRKISQ